VWLVVLSDQSYDSLFGPQSVASYLNGTLVPEGTLLSNYYASAHDALADGVALLAGQGPTAALQANCPTYSNITPGTVDPATQQVKGDGCVFPPGVSSLPEQLSANLYKWRAYVGGQGALTPGTTALTCRHPQLGAPDASATAIAPTDGYATRRNPFVYFHDLIDDPSCATSDVGLDQLAVDLQSGKVPAFSWIAPDLCSAGAPGACPTGDAVTGTAAADAWLAQWIPKIQATAAYRMNGMIVILSDEAPLTDSSACCRPVSYPNTTNPGGALTPGSGGGHTGALVLSPFAAPGAVDPTRSDHFTVLRTIEELFNLPDLGYATLRKHFGPTVFPSEGGGPTAVTTWRQSLRPRP
jgi:hypothetical protein